MQRRRQFVLFDKVAGKAVDQHIGWLHRRDVELGAAIIRMRLDAAIGDGNRPAVAEQQKLVRTHAIGRELANALEFRTRVIDADHAGGIVEIVLGGVEQRTVGRKHAVAEEMPTTDAGNGQRLVAAGMVEHNRESAGLPGKDHRALRQRIECDVVTAGGQVDGMQHLAGLGQDRRAIAAVALDESGGEDGVGGKRLCPCGRRHRGNKANACGPEEITTIDQRRLQD